VFEFRFEERWYARGESPPFLAEQRVGRLGQVFDAATKMLRAGWPMWFTITGVGFEVPGVAPDDEQAVVERLAGIGIDLPFEMFPSRTPDELGRALDGLLTRVCYERDLAWIHSPDYESERAELLRERPYILRSMLRLMHKVEQQGLEEEYPVEDDFDWGVVNGKSSALRWVFGDDWDLLDA
jgi:hypothetical protein